MADISGAVCQQQVEHRLGYLKQKRMIELTMGQYLPEEVRVLIKKHCSQLEVMQELNQGLWLLFKDDEKMRRPLASRYPERFKEQKKAVKKLYKLACEREEKAAA